MVRTDNDAWSLATGVGATATMVAAGRARASKADRPVITDRFAEELVRAVGIDFFTRWASGELDAGEVDSPGNPWGVQPLTEAQAVRTAFIDAFVADAVSAGIRQVVILASGLDSRGYRLAWPASMTVFEVDQPDVLAFKTDTLAALHAEPATDLRAVPVDLRHDWAAALGHAGFDAGQPTAWVAEGLLAYLPAEAQDRLLDGITALSADGSRLLAEVFWHSFQDQRFVQEATRTWYAHGLDVALDDLCYFGERNDVATYLDRRGWSSKRTLLTELLAAHGFSVPLSHDEQPPQADHHYCAAVR